MSYLWFAIISIFKSGEKVDSDARLRAIACRYAREAKRLRREVALMETEISDLKQRIQSLNSEIKMRDVQIGLQKLELDGIALVVERNRERVRAEIATAAYEASMAVLGKGVKPER